MAGLYIHVPYCKTRCIYCDFFTQTNTSSKSDYVQALSHELAIRKDYIGGETVKTIYFGGGTPSQLTIDDFDFILRSIRNNFDIDIAAEITLEANPDDLSEEYLSKLRELSFNRISIGIQSFDDKELLFLKRRHSANKAKEAILNSQKAGFANISLDLMYGLPNQTMEIWKNNLHEAIALNVQHISSYHLIYEQGTKLYKLFKSGEVKAVDENLSVDMFALMIDELSNAGFSHYEISNFAKDSMFSKHNSSYWLGEKYLGLGPAAHSFDGNNRAWNIASIPKYVSAIQSGKPDINIEYSDKSSRYNDFILTGMRTMWGVNTNILEQRFGSDMKQYCLKNVQRYINQGFASYNNDILKLTKSGIFISDGIMSDLMFVQ